MTEFEIVTQDRMFPPMALDTTKDIEGKENGWRVTLDGSLAKTAKLAFGAVGAMCIVSWAPVTFVAMTLVGVHLGDKLDWIHNEASRVWNAEIRTADGKVNQMRKVTLAAGLALGALLFPVLAGISLGQYIGCRLSPYLGDHVRKAVAFLTKLITDAKAAGEPLEGKQPAMVPLPDQSAPA